MRMVRRTSKQGGTTREAFFKSAEIIAGASQRPRAEIEAALRRGERLETDFAYYEREPAVTPESANHDYEPGWKTSPMQTDPHCQLCGEAKNTRVHR